MRHRRTIALAVLFSASSACQTTSIRSMMGDTARYESDIRGYVIRRPGNGAKAILFDPVRGYKVRCREDLDPWIEAWTQGLAEQVSDSSLDNNSFGYMFPFTLSMIAAGVVFLVPYAGTRVPYWAAKSRSADAVFDDAMTSFRARRYEEASKRLELALIKGDLNEKHRQYVDYYLGLSYEQLGRRNHAALAFARFIGLSTTEDGNSYDIAEDRLSEVGGRDLSKCQSQAPLTMPWKDGR